MTNNQERVGFNSDGSKYFIKLDSSASQSYVDLPQSKEKTPTYQILITQFNVEHDEDVALSEIIDGTSPLLIICDGVGGEENSRQFADWLGATCLDQIKNLHAQELPLADFITQLGLVLDNINIEAKAKHQAEGGASTLLIAFLYDDPTNKNQKFWIIVGVGNGFILRFTDTDKEGAQNLSPNQTWGWTNAFPFKVKPDIKAIPYQPNDQIFMATDGLESFADRLGKFGHTLDTYIQSKPNVPFGELFATIKNDHGDDTDTPHYIDDTTVAFIKTSKS